VAAAVSALAGGNAWSIAALALGLALLIVPLILIPPR
jgi:hypothetical protein